MVNSNFEHLDIREERRRARPDTQYSASLI